MTNTTQHAMVVEWKHVERFPDTDFMTPSEVLEHRLLTIPGIVGADVGPKKEIEGGEPYCTVTIDRASGYTLDVLVTAKALITGELPTKCNCVVEEDIFDYAV